MQVQCQHFAVSSSSLHANSNKKGEELQLDCLKNKCSTLQLREWDILEKWDIDDSEAMQLYMYEVVLKHYYY